ncbi:alpha/beta hydrolase [Microbacterium sp. NPDC016588]
MNTLLSVELIDGPLMPVVSAVTVVALLAVLIWRPRRMVLTLSVGAVAGIAMYVLARIFDALQTFQGPLPVGASRGAALAVAGMAIGVVGIARAPWGRRVLGVVALICSALTGALQVNASYGITHTLASIIGVQALGRTELPAADGGADDSGDLWRTWSPPPGMPTTGTVSALSDEDRIPSGNFAPRDASLYLPPAALVPDPPKLPLIVFMMGQPGSPDPTSLAKALDAFAQSHQGLAPIAIVADQTSQGDLDPSCADSAKYGAVETYFNTLIPQWALSHLNVTTDTRRWVIGGFSNGGSCALKWAAEHPETWGNLLDNSGNEFPASEHVDETIADVFGGDAAAFEAAKPSAILAAAPRGAYAGHTAIFTWGATDGLFGPGQQRNAVATEAVGFAVLAHAVPGAGHDGPALDGGLAFAIPALAPALGLAAPSS